MVRVPFGGLASRLTAIVATSTLVAFSAASAEPATASRVSSTAGGEGAVVAATASHRTRGHHRTYRRPRAYYGWSIGWGPYWGSYGGGYWYGPRWGYPVVDPRIGGPYGALDTDVSPERAEVWVDGRRVGVADEFDGFPDYLWLEKGTYDVVIYLPGFKTIARQYTIYPGLVIDVEDRMERGESIHPEELPTTSHERRDERLRRDREVRERLERSRQRAGDEWLDAREEPGNLLVRVLPADASVYLDGRFVGTGEDLARLRAGLLVDSGTHQLEIVRPGFESMARQVEIAAGDDLTVEIELTFESSDLP